ERTVSELIIATGTGEDQSAQKLGHYRNDSIPSVPRVFLYNRAHIYGYQLLASSIIVHLTIS
ncbi:hypothetical protein PMQ82_10585, partial [Bifidobacterium longum]|nr:hypothetical protein [Bifidobacterium longum]MDB6721234.1 hypothetical protein [Bifidobacterium longum]